MTTQEQNDEDYEAILQMTIEMIDAGEADELMNDLLTTDNDELGE